MRVSGPWEGHGPATAPPGARRRPRRAAGGRTGSPARSCTPSTGGAVVVRPLSSATPRNMSGVSRPSRGCCQPTSISKPRSADAPPALTAMPRLRSGAGRARQGPNGSSRVDSSRSARRATSSLPLGTVHTATNSSPPSRGAVTAARTTSRTSAATASAAGSRENGSATWTPSSTASATNTVAGSARSRSDTMGSDSRGGGG